MKKKKFILDLSPAECINHLEEYAKSPLMDLSYRPDRLKFRILTLKAEGKHREAREFYKKHLKNLK